MLSTKELVCVTLKPTDSYVNESWMKENNYAGKSDSGVLKATADRGYFHGLNEEVVSKLWFDSPNNNSVLDNGHFNGQWLNVKWNLDNSLSDWASLSVNYYQKKV